MKDQGKTQVRRRPLVGRNEFPPFKRNQIRWALHCYRWKAGLSWEKYPYEIAHALGIRELGEGLNSRDPRGFVLEGQTPKPEKLRLYERFIQKVAPEYARAFDEDEFTTTFADYLGRYLNPDWESAENVEELIRSAAGLERLVYFEPCPATQNFAETLRIWISVFRRIGDTPFLRVISVILDPVYIFQGRYESFQPIGTDEDSIAGQIQTHAFEAVLDMSFDDQLAIAEMWTGVAIPLAEGKCYLAILEDQVKERYLAQLSPCLALLSRSDGQWWTDFRYGKAGPDAPHIDTFLFAPSSGNLFCPHTERTVMLGIEHGAAENFFATMKFGARGGVGGVEE